MITIKLPWWPGVDEVRPIPDTLDYLYARRVSSGRSIWKIWLCAHGRSFVPKVNTYERAVAEYAILTNTPGIRKTAIIAIDRSVPPTWRVLDPFHAGFEGAIVRSDSGWVARIEDPAYCYGRPERAILLGRFSTREHCAVAMSRAMGLLDMFEEVHE